jgi:hypothetical protein
MAMLLLHSLIPDYSGLLIALYYPSAAIMPETDQVAAGFTFGPVDPSAFYRCNHTIPVSPFSDHQVAGNILAKFYFFSAAKLAFA